MDIEILKTPISFDQILTYFKAECISSDIQQSVYQVKSKEKSYTLYFYKTIENKGISCFSLNTFQEYQPIDLLYLLSERTSKTAILKMVQSIGKVAPTAALNNLTKEQLTNDIITHALQLSNFSSSGIKNNNEFDIEVFISSSFKNKVFRKKNTVCFPLFNSNKISNVCLYPNIEINNNTGIFLSNRLKSNHTLAVFFRPLCLIKHTKYFLFEDYYYALLSNNVAINDLNIIYEISLRFSLPVTIYIRYDISDALKAFRIFNSWIKQYPDGIMYIDFVANDDKYIFHIYSPVSKENILHLTEFINIINRALIIHYNDEMVVVDEDISNKLSLIKTSSTNQLQKNEVNISFPSDNDALCTVLNKLAEYLSFKEVKFYVLI